MLGAALYLALAVRHHRRELGARLGGHAARRAFFAAFFPPDFTSRWSEIAEGIAESLLDDGGRPP